MHLVQIFLPLYPNNSGSPLPKRIFAATRDELVAQFGGLTAYNRSPVSGLWQEDPQHTVQDDLVIYEVMADTLDEQWWHDYRATLEQRFEQEVILIRAQEIRML